MLSYPYVINCKKCGKKITVKYRQQRNCRNCKKEKEYLWESYNSSYYRNRKIVFIRDKNKCQCCNTSSRLLVHHIDCNKQNNSTSNLITLCIQCHASLHKRYSKEELRRSNIYLLFPKVIVKGKFGNRLKYEN